MQRNNGARLLPLLISLIVIALVIAAIVSIGRAIFNSGDDSSSPDQVETGIGRESLLKTDQGRSVRMTVRGPIVANEQFQSYTVSATPTNRALVVYEGYLDEETDSKELRNNTPAYEQFVYALDKAEMMKGEDEEDVETNDDLRGICATGYVYEFAALYNNQEVRRLWTSTCDGSRGTLQASQQQLTSLFLSQIPDANDLIPFQQSPLLRL